MGFVGIIIVGVIMVVAPIIACKLINHVFVVDVVDRMSMIHDAIRIGVGSNGTCQVIQVQICRTAVGIGLLRMLLVRMMIHIPVFIHIHVESNC